MTYADAVKDFMSLNPKYKDEAYGFVLQKWAMFKNGLICDRYITDREDETWKFPFKRKGYENVLRFKLY